MFSFYGTKRSKAHLYPSPKFDLIIEPFAGAAGYSVLHFEKNVELFDIDHRICKVWSYLINATGSDILNLPILNIGDNLNNFHYLSFEEKLFLGYMISASTRNPKKTATKKTNWTINKRLKISNFVKEIKHWLIFNSSYENIKNKKAVWFIDPPYFDAGKWYDFKLKPEEYNFLAKWSLERQGQIIVCENYGANWLPFQPLYNLKGQKNNNKIEGIFNANNF